MEENVYEILSNEGITITFIKAKWLGKRSEILS